MYAELLKFGVPELAAAHFPDRRRSRFPLESGAQDPILPYKQEPREVEWIRRRRLELRIAGSMPGGEEQILSLTDILKSSAWRAKTLCRPCVDLVWTLCRPSVDLV